MVSTLTGCDHKLKSKPQTPRPGHCSCDTPLSNLLPGASPPSRSWQGHPSLARCPPGSMGTLQAGSFCTGCDCRGSLSLCVKAWDAEKHLPASPTGSCSRGPATLPRCVETCRAVLQFISLATLTQEGAWPESRAEDKQGPWLGCLCHSGREIGRQLCLLSPLSKARSPHGELRCHAIMRGAVGPKKRARSCSQVSAVRGA